MKYILYVLTVTSILIASSVVPVQAQIEVVEPLPPVQSQQPSPLIITAVQSDDGVPDFIQLHNNSDSVVALQGWSILAESSDSDSEIQVEFTDLHDWIIPRGYLVVARDNLVAGADVTFSIDETTQSNIRDLTSHQLRVLPSEQSNYLPSAVTITAYAPTYMQRNRSTTASAAYLSTFSTITPDETSNLQLFGGGFYRPAATAEGLEIHEIHANARTCSPLETAIECNDYIKLFNASSDLMDVSMYRLRTDSGGVKSTNGNTVRLSGMLEPGAYVPVYLRDSGEPLSITNSGGHVWLEDTFGVVTYEQVISYPDSSAEAMKGQSWALDSSSHNWRWMPPMPNTANYWEPIQVIIPSVPVTEIDSGLSDCGPGRERNPETNRCRTIITAETTLQPCAEGQERNPDTNRCRRVTAALSLATCGPGQERNPETNRCRSVNGSVTALQPCAEGQERNPTTNRCRAVIDTASLLKPCAENQERNPETNRCRNVLGASDTRDSVAVIDIESKQSANATGWIIAGAAVFFALAYAAYEWRQDIAKRLHNLRLRLK